MNGHNYYTWYETKPLGSTSALLVDMKNLSWELQIDISKIDNFTNQCVKFQSVKCKLGHGTLTKSVHDVLSSTSKQWPSFKLFWWVELKTALY